MNLPLPTPACETPPHDALVPGRLARSVRLALSRGGRRHDPLRPGTHPPAGDRRPGATGSLSPRQDLCTGRPESLNNQPGSSDAARPADDLPGWPGSLRPYSRHRASWYDGPIVLAAVAGSGDLPGSVGQRRAGQEHLPGSGEVAPTPEWQRRVGRVLWIALGLFFGWVGLSVARAVWP